MMFKEIALKNKLLTILTFSTLIMFSAYKLLLSEIIRIDLSVAEKNLEISFLKLIFINITLLGIMFFLDYIATKYTVKFLAHCKHFLNNKLFKKIVKENKYYEMDNMEIISKFNNDIPIIINDYISVIISIAYFIFSCIIGLIYISRMNVWIAIYICSISILILVLTKYFSRKLSVVQKKLNSSLAEISLIINNYLKNFTLFKVFNLNDKLKYEFNETNTKHMNVYYRTNITTKYSEILNDLGGWIITCGLYLLGILLIQKRQMSFSDLVAAAQASGMVTTPIFWLSSTISSLSKSKLIREEFINYVKDTDLKNEEITTSILNDIKTIKLSNISLSYKGTSVFSNFNLCFKKGKKYAIIGKSGSGKSTILKMILRLINNYEGELLINDVNINDIDDRSIYSLISYVGQENFLLNDTIKNNITMYSNYDENKINTILELLLLNTFIEEKGLNYKIDENSTNISGGEKQRINIARALYKKSEILIMDEAFSSIDIQESKRIEKEILSMYDTVISIMHKYDEEILSNYDHIINFDII